jgi:hypothetical protein
MLSQTLYNYRKSSIKNTSKLRKQRTSKAAMLLIIRDFSLQEVPGVNFKGLKHDSAGLLAFYS